MAAQEGFQDFAHQPNDLNYVLLLGTKLFMGLAPTHCVG